MFEGVLVGPLEVIFIRNIKYLAQDVNNMSKLFDLKLSICKMSNLTFNAIRQLAEAFLKIHLHISITPYFEVMYVDDYI